MEDSQENVDRLELVALYVAGATDPNETAMVEAWLKSGDPEVTNEFASLGGVIESLIESSSPVTPPESILRAILKHLPPQASDDSSSR